MATGVVPADSEEQVVKDDGRRSGQTAVRGYGAFFRAFPFIAPSMFGVVLFLAVPVVVGDRPQLPQLQPLRRPAWPASRTTSTCSGSTVRRTRWGSRATTSCSIYRSRSSWPSGWPLCSTGRPGWVFPYPLRRPLYVDSGGYGNNMVLGLRPRLGLSTTSSPCSGYMAPRGFRPPRGPCRWWPASTSGSTWASNAFLPGGPPGHTD